MKLRREPMKFRRLNQPDRRCSVAGCRAIYDITYLADATPLNKDRIQLCSEHESEFLERIKEESGQESAEHYFRYRTTTPDIARALEECKTSIDYVKLVEGTEGVDPEEAEKLRLMEKKKINTGLIKMHALRILKQTVVHQNPGLKRVRPEMR